jgi:hypothetical protein
MFHACPVKPGCACDRNAAKLEYDWSFVDRVFCISLRDRDDRMMRAAEQFHRFGLCTRVEFYRPMRPSPAEVPVGVAAGVYGCWASHRAVLSHAPTSDKVLIFEDDVLLRPSVLTPAYLKTIADHVSCQLPSDWEVYFLGHMPHPWNRGTQLVPHLILTRSSQTHAYIASNRFAKRFTQLEYAQINDDVDHWIALHAKQFACWPMAAIQANYGSDVRPGCSNFGWIFDLPLIEWAITRQHEAVVTVIAFIIILMILLLITVLATSSIRICAKWTIATNRSGEQTFGIRA